MMDELYTLEWRGKQTSPMPLDTIREALEAGDIHSMYQINDRGRWRLLRDFLDDRRPVKTAPPPQPAYEAQPAYATPAQHAWPGGQSAVPPTEGRPAAAPTAMGAYGPAESPQPSAAAKFPLWLTATLIGLIVLIVPAGAIGVYLLVRNPAPPAAMPQTIGGAKSSSEQTAQQQKTSTNDSTGAELSYEEVAKLRKPYVVPVKVAYEIKTQKGTIRTQGSGSAVFLRRDKEFALFVTNLHVIDYPDEREVGPFELFQEAGVIVIGGEMVPYEVIAICRHDIDLAKIRIPWQDSYQREELPMVLMGEVHEGMECVAIGNALGYGLNTTNGIVSMVGDFGGKNMIRTSAPVSSGNSGGGLFRKRDGALIGITTSILLGRGGQAQNLNQVIPVDYIESKLFWEAPPK